jgi:hypothetical protein
VRGGPTFRFGTGARDTSFAPLGLFRLPALSHGLRHGLHSTAAVRLGEGGLPRGGMEKLGNRLR